MGTVPWRLKVRAEGSQVAAVLRTNTKLLMFPSGSSPPALWSSRVAFWTHVDELTSEERLKVRKMNESMYCESGRSQQVESQLLPHV